MTTETRLSVKDRALAAWQAECDRQMRELAERKRAEEEAERRQLHYDATRFADCIREMLGLQVRPDDAFIIEDHWQRKYPAYDLDGVILAVQFYPAPDIRVAQPHLDYHTLSEQKVTGWESLGAILAAGQPGDLTVPESELPF